MKKDSKEKTDGTAVWLVDRIVPTHTRLSYMGFYWWDTGALVRNHRSGRSVLGGVWY